MVDLEVAKFTKKHLWVEIGGQKKKSSEDPLLQYLIKFGRL